MTKEEKTKELIEALEHERDIFIRRGLKTTEHDATIDYLKNGYTNVNPDDWEMLDAAINDFDCLYSDYCS